MITHIIEKNRVKEKKMRKVKVNLSELIEAFDNCRMGYEFYL